MLALTKLALARARSAPIFVSMRSLSPAIPGFCVGCQKPTQRMPLCVQCAIVWAHDWDRFDDISPWAQQVRAKATAWSDAELATRVPATWDRPAGFVGPCPGCGSLTCPGWYKPDGNHALAF